MGCGEVLRISGGEIRMFIYVLSRSPAQIHLKWFWCMDWSVRSGDGDGEGIPTSHWELRISVGELRGRRSINIMSCQPCGHLLVVITTNEHFQHDHHQKQIRKTKSVNIGF